MTPGLRAAVSVVPGARMALVRGPDASPFLQGQLANDVARLPTGGCCRSLYLDHRGHALAEVMALRLGREEFALVEEGGASGWVRAELERHIVFDDVRVGEFQPAPLVTVQGELAAEILEAALGVAPPPEGETVVSPGRVRLWRRRRSRAGGYDALVEEGGDLEGLVGALRAAGAEELGPEGADLLRVRALIALAPEDAGSGVLPQEAGLEDALSYRKGCYLGQEIMARVEARGNVRRGLARLRFERDPRTRRGPDPGAEGASEPGWRELRVGGRVVGKLGTVVAVDGVHEALAVLRKDVREDEPVSATGVPAVVLERARA